MAGQQGSDANSDDAKTASDQIMEKAREAVKASEGKLDLGSAISNVRKENPDLAEAADKGE